jgi:hypothetical protein
VALSIFAVYAHLYALLLIASQFLSVRSAGRAAARGLKRAWIWIGAVSLPLVVFAAKTGAGPIRWIPRPGLHDVIEFAEHLAGNDGALLLLLYLAACTAAVCPPRKIFSGFDAESSFQGENWEIWRLRFLLIWLWAPIALMLLLSLARPLFLGRYFIFCLPALILLSAAGVAELRPTWLRAAVLGAMLLLSVQGVFSYYDRDFDLERDASGAAANYILDHAKPGDAILFHIAEARVPYEFFHGLRPNAASQTSPEIVYPRHGDSLDYRDFTGKPGAELIRSLEPRYPRLWVVLMSNGSPGHPDATTSMLDEELEKSYGGHKKIEFPQVEVTLYERR